MAGQSASVLVKLQNAPRGVVERDVGVVAARESWTGTLRVVAYPLRPQDHQHRTPTPGLVRLLITNHADLDLGSASASIAVMITW